MEAPRTCIDCAVRDRALCAGLADGALASLNALGRRRRLARGDTLIWAGGDNPVCGNLISGVMKLSASTDDGREQVVGLLHPSDFVGQPYAEEAECTATALGDVELCVFPRASFERMLEDHASMERQLLRRTLTALAEARARMLTLARLSARERVVGLLLDLVERVPVSRATPDGPASFELPLTRGEIAELLGLTIETVSRQLSRLKAQGAIALHGARGITIRDRAKLEGTDRRHAA